MSKRRRRNIILKARQKGITKIINADQLVECLHRPTNAVVISHEKEATRRLFRAVRYFLDHLPIPAVLQTDNKNELTFPKIGSSYYIGTAGAKAFGRGDLIHRAHLSEAAFYQDFEKILTGVSEAAEYGEVDIESTPNGRGNYFYDLWQKAKSGMSPYVPIFIPWFIDYEYSADNLTEDERAGLSPQVQELFALPEKDYVLDDQEAELVKRVLAEYGVTLTIGQLKWRKYKIWDKGELFFQEYPEDDVSCFLQSGRPVFRQITLKQDYKIDLEKITDSKLIEAMGKGSLYGGLDGAEGNLGGDRHCFAVIDCSFEPYRVIYEITNTDPIEVFDQRIAKLVRKFNIRLGVEKNGVGSAHILKLKGLGCPFREWNTTGASRPIMITDLEEAYRKGELVESYPEAQNEALDVFYDDQNRATHPQGKHDDRVFARAIAWQVRKLPQPRVSWI